MEIDLVDEMVNDTGEAGALLRRAVEVGIKEGPRVSPGSWGTIKVCCAIRNPTSPYHHRTESITACKMHLVRIDR